MLSSSPESGSAVVEDDASEQLPPPPPPLSERSFDTATGNLKEAPPVIGIGLHECRALFCLMDGVHRVCGACHPCRRAGHSALVADGKRGEPGYYDSVVTTKYTDGVVNTFRLTAAYDQERAELRQHRWEQVATLTQGVYEVHLDHEDKDAVDSLVVDDLKDDAGVFPGSKPLPDTLEKFKSATEDISSPGSEDARDMNMGSEPEAAEVTELLRRFVTSMEVQASALSHLQQSVDEGNRPSNLRARPPAQATGPKKRAPLNVSQAGERWYAVA